jgi:hypothetical protein
MLPPAVLQLHTSKQVQLQGLLCQLLQACLLAEKAAAQLACTSDSAAVGSTGLLKDASSTPDGRLTATMPSCRCFETATKQLSVWWTTSSLVPAPATPDKQTACRLLLQLHGVLHPVRNYTVTMYAPSNVQEIEADPNSHPNYLSCSRKQQIPTPKVVRCWRVVG